MDMAPDPALKPAKGNLLPILSGQTQDARWAALADAAAEPNAFYAPDMFRAALDHLDESKSVRLIEVFDGILLIGLLPVMVTTRHGRLPMATVANWMHAHCFLGTPMIRSGREQDAWAGFLRQLDCADWAPHFLHLRGLDAAGANAAALEAVCVTQGRPFREIGRYDRALLRSDLSAEAYWDANVRPKKRKEIRRLQKRLADLGALESRMLTDAADLSATAAAMANGNLEFLRIDLDDRAIAMLVNFRHLDGAFSFKIAIDEELGRFSPGVLIEIDNLRAVQTSSAISWMDSCAAPDHAMIDSLSCRSARFGRATRPSRRRFHNGQRP